MGIIRKRLIQLAAALGAAMAVSACGVTPADPINTSITPSLNPGDRTLPFRDGASLADEERDVRASEECGRAGNEFDNRLAAIVERFNTLVARTALAGQATRLRPAAVPGEGDTDNAVLALTCKDPLPAAYSYSQTVVLHDGLLYTLARAAGVYARFDGEDDTLDGELDRVVAEAATGPLDGAAVLVPVETARFDALLDSALAFVIYHELAHTILGHASMQTATGVTGPGDPSIEIQADIFAAMAMVSAGYSLEGVDLVFAVLERISPGGAYAHPRSLDRALTVRRATRSAMTSAE